MVVSKHVNSTIPKPLVLSKFVHKHDVLLGRGKKRFKHPGNIAYRAFIESRLSFYFKGDRTKKSGVVLEIIKSIKETGGRFLKNKGADWEEVDLQIVREKVGHSIRDHCKSNISFDFQEDTKEIFDEKATFDDVIAYVEDNYNPIVAQISAGDSLSNAKNPRYYKKQQQDELRSSDEDSDAMTPAMLEYNGLSSISLARSDVDNYNQEVEIEGVTRIPGRRESNLVRGARRRASSHGASFVDNFLFKLNEETEQLAQLESLESLRDNAVNFRLVSIASIREWIDVEGCSQPSDDEWWSEHLVSLGRA